MEILLKFIEPTKIKAGDKKLKINGAPPKVDCRIIAEQGYQLLITLLKEFYEINNEKEGE